MSVSELCRVKKLFCAGDEVEAVMAAVFERFSSCGDVAAEVEGEERFLPCCCCWSCWGCSTAKGVGPLMLLFKLKKELAAALTAAGRLCVFSTCAFGELFFLPPAPPAPIAGLLWLLLLMAFSFSLLSCLGLLLLLPSPLLRLALCLVDPDFFFATAASCMSMSYSGLSAGAEADCLEDAAATAAPAPTRILAAKMASACGEAEWMGSMVTSLPRGGL